MFSKTLIIIVCSSNKNTKNHNMKFCFYCPYNLLCVFTARNLHRRCTLDQFEVWNSVAYVPVLRPLPSTWRALMIRDHFLWNWWMSLAFCCILCSFVVDGHNLVVEWAIFAVIWVNVYWCYLGFFFLGLRIMFKGQDFFLRNAISTMFSQEEILGN